MQSEKRIIVLKFGSSVLRSENDLPTAVHEIYRWWREGFQVVAVVSAFGNTTDELTQRAHSVCDQPNDELVAALLATGEAASSALLGLALNRSGIRATVLDAEQAGLATDGPVLDANLTSIDTASVLESFAEWSCRSAWLCWSRQIRRNDVAGSRWIGSNGTIHCATSRRGMPAHQRR